MGFEGVPADTQGAEAEPGAAGSLDYEPAAACSWSEEVAAACSQAAEDAAVQACMKERGCIGYWARCLGIEEATAGRRCSLGRRVDWGNPEGARIKQSCSDAESGRSSRTHGTP